MEKIGNYNLLRKLGEGGMGVVYLGEEISSGNKVAVKILKADISADSDMTLRFNREIQVSKDFAHPFVIKILDGGFIPSKNMPYLVMEFLEGESLGDVGRRKSLSTEKATNIMCHLAEALSYIHKRGVVHRDIKPDNILIVSDSRTVLLDFGLALIENATRLSRTTDRPGTFPTMSPEQVGGFKLDGRSDIYSLGVTMYWAVTGKGAYTTEEIIQNAVGNITPMPPSPHLVNSAVSEQLSSIILKCMENNPKDRYSTGDELLKAIESPFEKRLCSSPPARSTTPLSTAPSAPNIRKRGRKKSAGHFPVETTTDDNIRYCYDRHVSGKLRRTFFFLAFLLIMTAGIVLVRNGRENKQIGKKQISLNSIRSEFLQSGQIPSKDGCRVIGEMIARDASTAAMEKVEGRPAEVAGLYYLYLSATKHDFWGLAFEAMKTLITRHGYNSLSQNSYEELELMCKVTSEGKLFDQFVNFCEAQNKEATSTKQKKDSLFALAQSFRILEKKNTPTSKSAKLTPLRKSLKLFDDFRDTYLSENNIGIFSKFYASVVTALNNPEIIKQAIVFIDKWTNEERITGENQMWLFNSAGTIYLESCEKGVKTLPLKNQVLGRQYKEKALGIARELIYRKLPDMEMSYARIILNLGEKKKAFTMANSLAEEHPAYLQSYGFVTKYTSILYIDFQTAKAKEVIRKALRMNETEGTFTKSEVTKLKKRSIEFSQFEDLMKVKDLGLLK